jgi:hypothetical protein
MTNTFSGNDSVLGGVWYAAETTEKPNSNGNTTGTTAYPAVTLNYNDESQQYWARLSNTDGEQEANLWNNPCGTASLCKHANIIRQWAELAYWFPATANAVGQHSVGSMASYDFTPYDPISVPKATHSFLKLAPYPSVWPAWQQVNGALHTRDGAQHPVED